MQDGITRTANKLFRSVAEFRYLGIDSTKSKFLKNVHYYSVQNSLSSCLKF